MNIPTISVIIPCYNHGQYVMNAIASVELFPDKSLYEIIIIKDGSNDVDTLNILQIYRNKFTVIDKKNGGLSSARNAGIKIAKGKYILPLDSDNKIRPAYLTESIKILDQKPEIGVVYGSGQLFGEENAEFRGLAFDLGRMVKLNYIDACAVYRKSAWHQVSGYDEHPTMRLGFEDWDFWLRILQAGWQFHYIDKILFDYRVRSDSMLRTISHPNKEKLISYIFSKPSNNVVNWIRTHLEEVEKLTKLKAKITKLNWEIDGLKNTDHHQKQIIENHKHTIQSKEQIILNFKKELIEKNKNLKYYSGEVKKQEELFFLLKKVGNWLYNKVAFPFK